MRALFQTIFIIDQLIFLQIFNWNGKKYLDQFFLFVSRSADGYLYVLISILLLILEPKWGSQICLVLLISFAIEIPIYKIIKDNIKRHRPHEHINGIDFLISPPDRFSFPSGHTAGAFIFAILLSSHYSFIDVPLLFWAASVGLSRIYLGVHYPSDVIAGIFLGTICAIFGISMV